MKEEHCKPKPGPKPEQNFTLANVRRKCRSVQSANRFIWETLALTNEWSRTASNGKYSWGQVIDKEYVLQKQSVVFMSRRKIFLCWLHLGMECFNPKPPSSNIDYILAQDNKQRVPLLANTLQIVHLCIRSLPNTSKCWIRHVRSCNGTSILISTWTVFCCRMWERNSLLDSQTYLGGPSRIEKRRGNATPNISQLRYAALLRILPITAMI